MSFSGTKGWNTKPKPGVMLNPLHPLSKGLVGYWLFNEGSGSQVYDISGHANHGTLQSGVSWKNGNLFFDGTENSHIIVPHSASIDYIKEFSFCAAFSHIDSNSTTPRILSKRSAAGYAKHAFIWEADDAVELDITTSDGITTSKTSNGSVLQNTDYQFIGTYNDNQDRKGRVYLDGILSATSVAATGTLNDDSGQDLYIGNRSTGGRYYEGEIMYLYLYDRILTPFETKQLHHNPFCNLLQIPNRRCFVAAPPVGVIMNQFQRANLGADLYNGVFA